jgi:hypothetical protein
MQNSGNADPNMNYASRLLKENRKWPVKAKAAVLAAGFGGPLVLSSDPCPGWKRGSPPP